MMGVELQKKKAARAALEHVKRMLDHKRNLVVGVGTGSTTNFFIDELTQLKFDIDTTIASSKATESRLKAQGFSVVDLNAVDRVDVYVDGADEVDDYLNLIKGGGGALTREKILATVCDEFVCIVDQSKKVSSLGNFPLPIEVIPMARGYVARELVKLGGNPQLRAGFVTDNHNLIIDVLDLPLAEANRYEKKLNNICGVVCNGIFSQSAADIVYIANDKNIESLERS